MLTFYLCPSTILSGFIRSLTAVPSAKNYGLLAITYLCLLEAIDVAPIISLIILDVPIGTVDF
jgi:hypothetical protein